MSLVNAVEHLFVVNVLFILFRWNEQRREISDKSLESILGLLVLVIFLFGLSTLAQ